MEMPTEHYASGMYDVNAKKFIVKGYGATGGIAGGKTLQPIDIERNEPGPDEILVQVMYCGVCHSDIHQVNNDWKNTIYPCVPGHEIIGRVAGTGSKVTMFRTGDIVGIGCLIDSCGTCNPCRDGEEQFCQGEHSSTMTYNGFFQPSDTKFNTYGGYSTHVIAKEHFVLPIPKQLDIVSAAPILCAGITTYSPMKHFGVRAGHKVGVVGIGGLGHMAVKIAKAMGADVTAITTKEEKRDLALELGADNVLVSENKEEMNAYEMKLDFIIVTIPYPFDVNPYICLLNARGSLVTVGLLGPYDKPIDNNEVAKFGRSVGGSLIGGIAETKEVLDFCAAHNIVPEIQLINIQDINDAFQKIKDEDVRFRYVIDMRSLS